MIASAYTIEEISEKLEAAYYSFIEMKLLSDICHKMHWRKLGISSGKELPFKDFRSLRSEIGGR